MHPEEKVIRMAPGKQSPLIVRTTPTPAILCDYVYRSEDPGIVKVDDNGILTAVAPGKTKVYVEAATSHDAKPTILTTFVNVFVEGEVKGEAESTSPAEAETNEELTEDIEPESESGTVPGPLLGEEKKSGSRLMPLWIALIAAGFIGLILALVLGLRGRKRQDAAEEEAPQETEEKPETPQETEPQEKAEKEQ